MSQPPIRGSKTVKEQRERAQRMADTGYPGRRKAPQASVTPLASGVREPERGRRRVVSSRQGVWERPVTKDRFFPDFPEEICMIHGCDIWCPHTHVNDDEEAGDLKSEDDYRREYLDLEKQEARIDYTRSARGRSKSNPRPQNLSPSSPTDTVKRGMPVAEPRMTRRKSLSEIKPPSSRATSEMRKALPEVPKVPRREAFDFAAPINAPQRPKTPLFEFIDRVKAGETGFAPTMSAEPAPKRQRNNDSQAVKKQPPKVVATKMTTTLETDNAATWTQTLEVDSRRKRAASRGPSATPNQRSPPGPQNPATRSSSRSRVPAPNSGKVRIPAWIKDMQGKK